MVYLIVLLFAVEWAQNQSQWLADRMNSDPFMTSHTREVDDVEMVLLSVLDHTGQLSVPARVDGFFALMCRVHKVWQVVFAWLWIATDTLTQQIVVFFGLVCLCGRVERRGRCFSSITWCCC